MDSFSVSNVGDNPDEPGRKLTRTAVVIFRDQLRLGIPGCRPANIRMESIRFAASGFLIPS